MIRKMILKHVSPLIDDVKGDSIVRDECLRFKIAGLNKRIEKLEMIIKKCRLYDDTNGVVSFFDAVLMSDKYGEISNRLYADKKTRMKPLPLRERNSGRFRSNSKRIRKNI